MMRNMEDTMSEDELRKEKRIGFFLIVILLTFLSVLVLAYIKTAEENCIGLDVTCPDSKEGVRNDKIPYKFVLISRSNSKLYIYQLKFQFAQSLTGARIQL